MYFLLNMNGLNLMLIMVGKVYLIIFKKCLIILLENM